MKQSLIPSDQAMTQDLLKLSEIFREKLGLTGSYKEHPLEDTVISSLADLLIKADYSIVTKHGDEEIRKADEMCFYGYDREICAFNKRSGIVVDALPDFAVENEWYKKDFFEASTTYNARYLCLGIKQISGERRQYDEVCRFFRYLYDRQRCYIPLKAVLIIGY